MLGKNFDRDEKYRVRRFKEIVVPPVQAEFSDFEPELSSESLGIRRKIKPGFKRRSRKKNEDDDFEISTKRIPVIKRLVGKKNKKKIINNNDEEQSNLNNERQDGHTDYGRWNTEKRNIAEKSLRDQLLKLHPLTKSEKSKTGKKMKRIFKRISRKSKTHNNNMEISTTRTWMKKKKIGKKKKEITTYKDNRNAFTNKENSKFINVDVNNEKPVIIESDRKPVDIIVHIKMKE